MPPQPGLAAHLSDPYRVRGLHDPRLHHESCGVAFVASLRREPTHEVVSAGLEALRNLGHRGATGSDPLSGDGAGILLQTPDALLRREAGFALPGPGAYGVGMAFLPRDASGRADCEALVAGACHDEGLRLLGWRDVPVEPGCAGPTALAGMPVTRQLFVAAVGLEGDQLERRLYVLRRVIERRSDAVGLTRDHFHLASLSSRTVVYKGMLTADQLPVFYPDLRDPAAISRLAMVHARFSTNVLPRWDLAQPFRLSAHNGEINTLRGNVNWMRARQSKFRSPHYGADIAKLRPVIDELGSDSSQFDNALELLTMAGRSVEHAIMMMIPEAWDRNPLMDEERHAFYEFHASLLEPWDGPAAIAFTDGRLVGATLDRNGLRPARWLVTDNGWVVMASEAGVLPIPEERITKKWRLEPGRLLLVDTEAGEILDDDAVKSVLSRRHPYRQWIRQGAVRLDELDPVAEPPEPDPGTLLVRHRIFGYTEEELKLLLAPMARDGEEPVGSMGNDSPLAVLSERPVNLFAYFKQLFAQVTNPPIDPIREELVMSLATSLGAGGNLLEQGPAQAKRLEVPTPILSNADLETIRHVTQRQFPAATVSITFHSDGGVRALEEGLERICRLASEKIREGYTVLVLSDRHVDANHAPIPSLLATAAVHHHLVREHTRSGVGLVVETGEAREVMHVALLVGFGAETVNPYLALETVGELHRRGLLPGGTDLARARERYIHALYKGVRKVISKMGISTIESYAGAQIFEAVGLAPELVSRYFPGTASRIGGVDLDIVAEETLMRHRTAFPERSVDAPGLPGGGEYQWRRDGEAHAWNPTTISLLQHAVRGGGSETYRAYAEEVDDESRTLKTLRGLLEIQSGGDPVPLDEVEPATEIVRRFCTGAMSFGAISKEMHETLAIAMNRLGAKSNTGEGGEDPARYVPDANGDDRRSAIKQVASGRFGVTANYLVNADELQIKIAQGAKPGEGGQLPGGKVDEVIARLRFATPGVGLISPPPHHDIYSIEDLAQLIHDLKMANPRARISVKLVSEVGVGTVAAGVAKARADHIVIAGYEGGTGASPLSSVKHAGVPWELGLAETQQVMVDQGLRSRVVLQVDGQMKTGRDVVVAALLGADEFGFSTAPLIASGCVMMRVCHLNTCPVGIATQDPELRRRFAGTPEHVIGFMLYVAEDVRERMAALGFRRFEEMVGRSDLLHPRSVDHWKASRLDLSALLRRPEAPAEETRHTRAQQHHLEDVLDQRLIELATPALERGDPVRLKLRVRNVDRTVGGMLSGAVARRYGEQGLPDDTIRIDLHGSAGGSFGAWLAPGITLSLRGEANDYVGKGLSGGRLVISTPPGAARAAEENVVAGNVALYGATAGEMFVNGMAGERFAVRNSGAVAVVEGVGDHACEYMTGGRVVILGRTGRNLAAGMSGGIAYAVDLDGRLHERCNLTMVGLEELDGDDAELIHELIQRHHAYTGSLLAARMLDEWTATLASFVKVMPNELRRVLSLKARLDVPA
ncbi:MAG: glutamate synthase large subunit [Candidatus Dormibacteria bacterium]|jgi:glutamate synthase domain-containing protein 2/glutamate synthase domain-containing protein 1/glutamate synthase domain-containing protein 3